MLPFIELSPWAETSVALPLAAPVDELPACKDESPLKEEASLLPEAEAEPEGLLAGASVPLPPVVSEKEAPLFIALSPSAEV